MTTDQVWYVAYLSMATVLQIFVACSFPLYKAKIPLEEYIVCYIRH